MGLDTVKKYFAEKKQTKAQKEELQKMQKYYTALRNGAAFVQAIQKDLLNQKNQMNRHQRRRFEKTLVKGEFTPELVNHYKTNLDKILENVNEKLNPSKEVDAVKLYEDAKRKENK